MDMTGLLLLPQPRSIERHAHTHTLQPDRLIWLDGPAPQVMAFAARRFQQALIDRAGLPWSIVAGATALDRVGLALRLTPDRLAQPAGYELLIEADRITIAAHDAAGIFYGVCTLIQLLDALDGLALPGLRIEDWPDFPVRGLLLDISRDKVPTLDTTKQLIDRLASWKINQFQLYTEHTFAYRRHPDVWANASPFTGEEILELDAYCRERFIELVPNQNSFGHLHRWFEHPAYLELAEAPDGFDFPWGHSDEPFSLNPTDPRSLELVKELFDELLPHFTSKAFNVGCDETFDVGQGRSRAESDRLGAGRVYLDFVRKVYEEVKRRDHIMQFWGDIIVQYPALIPELPKDAIALEWGYEAQHPFDEHGAQFAQAGLPFYLCPGTSTWNSLGGRTTNALGNLQSAAVNGLKHGASGYLNTEWGDNGHWQTLPTNYLGYAMGAAYSWAWEANREADVPQVISHFAFDDPSGNFGRVAYDLGEVYRVLGIEPHNSSVLFWMLQWPLPEVGEGYRETVSPETLHTTLAAIDQAMVPLSSTQSRRSDAALLKREFELAARMMRHAARRGLYAIGVPDRSAAELDRDLGEIVDEYQAVWLLRNRPGGLSDSLARLERSRRDYLA
jgi:hexosaminidase